MTEPDARQPSPAAGSRAAYEAWHSQVYSESAVANAPWHQLVLRHARRADLDGCRVLDIGCGRGELAVMVAQRSDGEHPRQVVGVDFAQSALRFALDRARRVTHGRSTFAAADIQNVFDTVISCETIEHVSDPVAAVRELYRILRPGRRLLLTTPNYLGPFGLYRLYLRLRGRRYTEGGQPICHLTSVARTAWWIRRAGFRLVHVDATGQYVLRRGRVPVESPFLTRHSRWLWPFGLHSIFICEKPTLERR